MKQACHSPGLVLSSNGWIESLYAPGAALSSTNYFYCGHPGNIPLLLHRFIDGAPGWRRARFADRDTQSDLDLDDSAHEYAHPYLDRPFYLFPHPSGADADPVTDPYTIQHLDTVAYPAAYGDIHALASPDKYDDAYPDLYLAALANLHPDTEQYAYQHAQSISHSE
jgi:hypothetical protein